jgi:nucleotide-binding universal stress UspA family protein
MKTMLIAIDDSRNAMKAVEYIATQCRGTEDLRIGLVYVLPNLPAIFWDEGHILSEGEKQERKRVVDKWLADRRTQMEPVFQKATEILKEAGISSRQIQTKSISDSTDVAESILEEARNGGYQTIVVGRRGISEGKRLLLGGVTNKIITNGSGFAITIVE